MKIDMCVDMTSKILFKEVKILPEYQRPRGKWEIYLNEFRNSEKGICELVGVKPTYVTIIRSNIRKYGLSSEMWVTTRNKKVYIISIKRTGLRKTWGSGSAGIITGTNKKVKVNDILDGKA